MIEVVFENYFSGSIVVPLAISVDEFLVVVFIVFGQNQWVPRNPGTPVDKDKSTAISGSSLLWV